MLLVFLLRRKSFPFVVMIKKEAGNRGVVCRRSGFCHGEVSNTDCLFVVVGFEAHTLGAFTFVFRRFSLFWKQISRSFNRLFPGLFALVTVCGGVSTRKYLYKYTKREREKKSRRGLSPFGHGLLRVCASAYTCLSKCTRVCAHARFPNKKVAS